MSDATITSFDQARTAVRDGTAPREVAVALVATMTADEKLWCLDGDAPTWAGLAYLATGGYHHDTFGAAHVERIGLPGIEFSDGPRGMVIGNGTCFPVSMARGATWDPELEERIGEAIGAELRASGATLYGGVCVNLLRHPAWGRAQETYGEDPLLLGEMGAALARGVQRHVMACVKHFACNSMENARFKVDVTVDEVALHEVYLPHFARIVDEGVASVMSAYNSLNGEWCGDNNELLTQILRDEWGFEGFVISDWIFGLRDAARSLHAGLDIEMPYHMVRATHLRDALDAGTASWDDVDSSVTRIVSTLLRFDDVLSRPAPDRSVVAGPAHRALAREAAARSVVLLRNEPADGTPALPLSTEQPPTIAVLGRLADAVNLGDGGSSDVWALDVVTPLAGLRAAAPDAVIGHEPGDDVAAAAALASRADVAVVIVGYTFADEGECITAAASAHLGELFPGPDDPELLERFQARLAQVPEPVTPAHLADRPTGLSPGGDRASLRLHPDDVALVKAVAAANPRTVVVVQAGSAVVCSEWDDQVPAIVQAWYGGSECGNGLADVLFGAENPSARLPFSVPSDESHLPAFEREAEHATYDRWLGWWHLEREGHRPAYPFGFGLSYTTFELGTWTTESSTEAVTLRGTLTNTGPRDGADVVQVYATLPDRSAPRRLVGFARAAVPAGGTVQLEVQIPLERLAARDPHEHRWVAPHGAHTFAVARHAGDAAARELLVEL